MSSIVREFNSSKLEELSHLIDEVESHWDTTPRPQDVYAGFQSHQEVLEIDYEMCRAYTEVESVMRNSYNGEITVCEDA